MTHLLSAKCPTINLLEKLQREPATDSEITPNVAKYMRNSALYAHLSSVS